MLLANLAVAAAHHAAAPECCSLPQLELFALASVQIQLGQRSGAFQRSPDPSRRFASSNNHLASSMNASESEATTQDAASLVSLAGSKSAGIAQACVRIHATVIKHQFQHSATTPAQTMDVYLDCDHVYMRVVPTNQPEASLAAELQQMRPFCKQVMAADLEQMLVLPMICKHKGQSDILIV
jgi:hypothetical protein